jgi:glycosyltransferase involved in cell wall biosynthesis
MDSSPMPLDVVLVSHNQERFIERAVDSILCQKGAFQIRIIVADDDSTDSTMSILRRYAEQHPEIAFIFLPQTSRLGVTKNYLRAFQACNSEFVAVLEGDDYWRSPRKLALQVGFLREHPECVMCGCNYYILDEARHTFELRVHEIEGHSVHDVGMTIRENVVGNFSTSVYRREILNRLPKELFDLVAYDWAVNICVGIHGHLGLLHEPLSVYRVHDRGAWNRLSVVEKLEEQLALIPQYDRLTNLRFHDAFEDRSRRLRRNLSDNMALGLLEEWCPPFAAALLRRILPPAILRGVRNFLVR